MGRKGKVKQSANLSQTGHWQYSCQAYLCNSIYLSKKMQNKNMKNENRFPDAENQGNSGNIDINTDENLSGSTHLNDPVSDESELEKLRTELEEQKEKYLRKVAEFDNYMRRTQKEKNELRQTAGKEVI